MSITWVHDKVRKYWKTRKMCFNEPTLSCKIKKVTLCYLAHKKQQQPCNLQLPLCILASPPPPQIIWWETRTQNRIALPNRQKNKPDCWIVWRSYGERIDYPEKPDFFSQESQSTVRKSSLSLGIHCRKSSFAVVLIEGKAPLSILSALLGRESLSLTGKLPHYL